jgi:hypothetical protein
VIGNCFIADADAMESCDPTFERADDRPGVASFFTRRSSGLSTRTFISGMELETNPSRIYESCKAE